MLTIQEILQNPDFTQKFILEKLLIHHLALSREELWLQSERELEPDLINLIKEQYHAYQVEKKPLEYILGKVSFFGIDFFVNEDTLIPRPETEYMIQGISEYLQSKGQENRVLMDIGTGCGVLGISTLLQNPQGWEAIFFTDISPQALDVAQKNYQNLIKPDYSTHFLVSDLCKFWVEKEKEFAEKEIILIANLPYIPHDTFLTNAPQNVLEREPMMAFVGGEDGLDYYRQMFVQWENLESRKQVLMFLEMMSRQQEILEKEFANRIHFEAIKTFHFNIIILKANFIN